MTREIREVVMNVRFVVSLALLLSSYAPGQQALESGGETGQDTRVAANAGVTFRQKVMDQIAREEEALRRGEAAHIASVELGRGYEQLGLMYQSAAAWERAEAALKHAVPLLGTPSAPSEDLAGALSYLGNLHVMMGKLRESEKEELEALKLRQDLGDPLLVARSWNDLAVLNLKKQKFEKTIDFGRRAETEFVKNGKAEPLDRISVRLALAEALCSLNDCASTIPMLKATLAEATATLPPEQLPVGFSDFLLGYAYWKSGEMSLAGECMERGTKLMSIRLGWGHPAYLNALKHYASFLRENQRIEAANVVERQIRQAEAVVDVHSIQTSQGMFGSNGLR
jgi:tetratricopeptide (TPR) repeat protein